MDPDKFIPNIEGFIQEISKSALNAFKAEDNKGVFTSATLLIVMCGTPTDKFANLNNLLKDIHDNNRQISRDLAIEIIEHMRLCTASFKLADKK